MTSCLEEGDRVGEGMDNWKYKTPYGLYFSDNTTES